MVQINKELRFVKMIFFLMMLCTFETETAALLT